MNPGAARRLRVLGSAWAFGLAACGAVGGPADGSSPVCQDACAVDEVRCTLDGRLQPCAGPDERGCLVWGTAETCPAAQVCAQGRCACPSPCQLGETRCLETVGAQSCQGEVGCLVWGALEPCAAGWVCDPELATCLRAVPPECPGEHECDFPGQKVCVTRTQYRACKVGAEGCLVLDCSS